MLLYDHSNTMPRRWTHNRTKKTPFEKEKKNHACYCRYCPKCSPTLPPTPAFLSTRPISTAAVMIFCYFCCYFCEIQCTGLTPPSILNVCLVHLDLASFFFPWVRIGFLGGLVVLLHLFSISPPSSLHPSTSCLLEIRSVKGKKQRDWTFYLICFDVNMFPD